MKIWKRALALLFFFGVSGAHAQDSITAGGVLQRFKSGRIEISGQFNVPNDGMFGGGCLAAQLELKFCATDQECGVAPVGGYAYCAQHFSPRFSKTNQLGKTCWVRPGPPSVFCRNSVTLAAAQNPGEPDPTPVPVPKGVNVTPWVRPPTTAVWPAYAINQHGDTRQSESRPIPADLRWAVVTCTNVNWRPGMGQSPCSMNVAHPNKSTELGESTLVHALEYWHDQVVQPNTVIKVEPVQP